VDLLDLATLLHLYVINNIPLAFAMFAAFIAFVAFSMLPSAAVHDDGRCDAAA